MKVKRKTANKSKKKTLDATKTLAPGQRIYVRKLTGRERLRAMGVAEKYINRMSNSDEELMKIGYTLSEINKLLSVEGKRVRVSDKQLCRQAGNSIVVDVLYHVFGNLLMPNRAEVQLDMAA